MLAIQSADGVTRLIAHLHKEDLRVLDALKQKFNGEIAFWDCRGKLWFPLADLILTTAIEVDSS